MDAQFDVFISYNWDDKHDVVKIAKKLRQRGLEVWLDEEGIKPGESIPGGIDAGLRHSRSVAIFIGPNQVGPFQAKEIEAIVMEHINRGIPAISVLLPGGDEDAIEKLPRLLTQNRWIDFRGGVDVEESLYLLHWGITGKRPPEERAPAEEEGRDDIAGRQRDLVEDVLDELAEKLETENVTYFLGPCTGTDCAPVHVPGCDIARGLLSELDVVVDASSKPLPPVTIAGMYYSAKSGDRRLEKRVMDWVAASSKNFPPAHDQLATLLKLLPSRPARRGGSKVPQLVVTTNIDLMMERALLRAGLSFTRVIQHRSGEQVDIDRYSHVQLNNDGTVQLPPVAAGGAPLQARINNLEELDAIINIRRRADEELSKRPPDDIHWQEMPEPILYKFLGSQEVTNSCVLSISHHFNFPRRVLQRKSIPAHINYIISDSTTLFLGPLFTDSDFQLTYYTLLCDAFRLSSDKRYAVQLPPKRSAADFYRQMDSHLWEEIKDNVMTEMRIKTIEVDVADFLRRLCAKL